MSVKWRETYSICAELGGLRERSNDLDEQAIPAAQMAPVRDVGKPYACEHAHNDNS